MRYNLNKTSEGYTISSAQTPGAKYARKPRTRTIATDCVCTKIDGTTYTMAAKNQATTTARKRTTERLTEVDRINAFERRRTTSASLAPITQGAYV